MDSDSMQSSSGGDEDYDHSRAEPISTQFLNANFHGEFRLSQSTQQPSLLPHYQNHQNSMFNPPTNSQLQDIHGQQPQLNSNQVSVLTFDHDHQGRRFVGRSEPGSVKQGSSQVRQSLQARSTRKRSRASRQSSATVLTTDTSNFRAMVQEFTGNVAPQFSGSPYSRLLNLSSSAIRSGHLEPKGVRSPLLLSVQKVQPPSFSSSSFINGGFDSSTLSSCQLQSGHVQDLQKQSANNMAFMPNPMPLYHSLNVPSFGEKFGACSAVHSLEELGMDHVHVNENLGGTEDGNIGSTSKNDAR